MNEFRNVNRKKEDFIKKKKKTYSCRFVPAALHRSSILHNSTGVYSFHMTRLEMNKSKRLRKLTAERTEVQFIPFIQDPFRQLQAKCFSSAATVKILAPKRKNNPKPSFQIRLGSLSGVWRPELLIIFRLQH